MALLNATKKKTVEDLAKAGNTAAQAYIAGGGKISGSTEITKDDGSKLTSSDVVSQVASGNVGGYNVTQRSKTIGQIAMASGLTSPTDISKIGPSLSSTSLVAPNQFMGTYNPATVGYRSSLVDAKGESFYSEKEAKKQAEQLMQTKAENLASTTPIPEQVSIQDGLIAQEKARALLDKYGAMAVTQPEWQDHIQSMLSAGLENINKQNPTPRAPIFETAAQKQLIDSQDESTKSEYRQFYDEAYKAIGLDKAQEQRIDLMKKMQVVQETYQKVIDTIKENPNLPKGLAARRLTDVFEDQKFAANALISQLEIVDQQIQDGYAQLDREMGIYEYEQTQEEKAMERKQTQFEYLVSSGAIAALSPAEMSAWSAATGIPVEAIKSMKTSALDPEKSYAITYEQDELTGEKFAVYVDKNNPAAEPVRVSLGTFGVKSSGGGGGGADTINYDTQIRNLVGSGFFSEAEAREIVQGMASIGREAYLDLQTGLSEAEKNAARKAFGGGEAVSPTQIQSTAQGLSTSERLSYLTKEGYTNDDLFKLAKEAGYARLLTNKTADINRFLESPEGVALIVKALTSAYESSGKLIK